MLRLDPETAALRRKAATCYGNMKTRCNNPANHAYKNYGARGIAVSPKWARLKDFLSDMGLPPSLNHSIDRIDNDRHYEPGNCRWATAKEQARNKRTNVNIWYRNKWMNVRDFADQVGIPREFAFASVRYKKLSAKKVIERFATTERSPSKLKGRSWHVVMCHECNRPYRHLVDPANPDDVGECICVVYARQHAAREKRERERHAFSCGQSVESVVE